METIELYGRLNNIFSSIEDKIFMIYNMTESVKDFRRFHEKIQEKLFEMDDLNEESCGIMEELENRLRREG